MVRIYVFFWIWICDFMYLVYTEMASLFIYKKVILQHIQSFDVQSVNTTL